MTDDRKRGVEETNKGRFYIYIQNVEKRISYANRVEPNKSESRVNVYIYIYIYNI